MQHTPCPRCGQPITTNGPTICTACTNELQRRIDWLNTIGMPTLQQITYRKANLTTPSPRTGNKPYPSTPLDPDAQHTYTQTEQTLQALAGSIGLRPIGWDRDEQPRTLRDWTWLCPRLIGHTDALIRTEDMAYMLDRLTAMCERVRTLVTRPSERRLVGVCTECLKHHETVTDPETGQDEEQPVRTPIYATPADTYAVCPECGAFLTLSDIRLAYLKAAGLLHITRTHAEAAQWASATTGIHVTGKDIRNWRIRGKMPSTRHVEGPYWAFNLIELLACAEERRRGSTNITT